MKEMIRPQSPMPTIAGLGERDTPAATQLHRPLLVLARIGWFATLAFTLSVYTANLPAYTSTIQTVCWRATCSFGQLSPDTAMVLERFGLPVSGYAVFMLVLAVFLALACCTAGSVIFWRKPDDWIALLFAFALVEVGTVPVILTLETSHLAWPWPIKGVWELSTLAFFSVTLFPDGRFVPDWTRWVVVAFSLLSVVDAFFTNPFTGLFPVPIFLEVAVVLLELSLVACVPIAQIYRYRYASTPTQRQQIRWMLWAISMNGGAAVAGYLPALIFPDSLFPLVFTLALCCTSFLYPFAISFSILRYRMWEIDVLIRRTLVYGSLTAVLALLYVSLVVGLQQLLHLVIAQESQPPIFIVASTLAIVALFHPLRQWLQRVIDRRFYRSKYDAVQTLATFSATVRNEVDLEYLTEHLLTVIQETMQPVSVSLWFVKSEDESTGNLPTPQRSSED